MPRSTFHRLFTGFFAIWFVALGLTRGTYMACLDHRAAHLAEAAVLAGAQVAPPVDAHAGHGAHAGPDAGAAAADAALPRISIACAPDARVAPAIPEFAQTARPSTFVPHLLPFATAPPAAPLVA